ncbi:hypothetical protein [Amycolatopsis viridis]|uniref:Uncharacterized protein n=1 Tax=Amycolatopsis viridis TaxID=185678 RepID=A0ABX0SPN9_9PSEU|nr:hypothetical protein [Amycolatopsis viridis]NIH77639.1 hypothetical protein [Amycolatopsis viridis]
MSRLIHAVGSLPPAVAPDAETGMKWLVDSSAVDGQADGGAPVALTALPCDGDPDWIVQWLHGLRDVEDPSSARRVFEIVADGDSSDYDRVPMYRVAKGVKLQPEHVSLQRRQDVEGWIGLAEEVRRRAGADQLRFQVGIPSPLDLTTFALANPRVLPKLPVGQRLGAMASMLRLYPVFRTAVLDDVRAIHDSHGENVVFQVEAPSVLVVLWSAPAAARPLAAKWLAGKMAGLLAGFPQDAEVVLHLCYGDLAHRSLVTPDSFGPAVLFLNALAAKLGRRLPKVHLPAAFGDHPPSTDEAFYRPLRQLRPGYELYAGVAHHDGGTESREALRLFEDAFGRQATAVSTACGLGRHTAEQAEGAIQDCRDLAGVSRDEESAA